MRSFRCEYCGNVYDPVKNGTCPNCGAAVSPLQWPKSNGSKLHPGIELRA